MSPAFPIFFCNDEMIDMSEFTDTSFENVYYLW